MNNRFDDRERSMRDRDSRRYDDRGEFDSRSDEWQRHDMGISGNALAPGRGERPQGFYDRDHGRDQGRHSSDYREQDRGYGGDRGYGMEQRRTEYRDGGSFQDRRSEGDYGSRYEERHGYRDSRHEGGYRDDRERMDRERMERGRMENGGYDRFRDERRGGYEHRDGGDRGRDHYRLRDDQRHDDHRDRYSDERDRRHDQRDRRDIIDRDEDGNYRYSGRDAGFSWSDGSNSATWGDSNPWGNEYGNHSRGEGIGWNRGSTRDPRFWSTPDRDR